MSSWRTSLPRSSPPADQPARAGPVTISTDTDRYRSGTRRRRIERVATSQLQHYERTNRALAAELAQVGFISQASIVHRYLVREPGLPLPTRPATTPRPLLPVEPRRGRQDREPLAQPERGRALPQLNRQPATPRTNQRPDGADLSRRRRTPPTSKRPARTTPVNETLTPTSGGPNAPREVRKISLKGLLRYL
jgi:hypothetical protein